MIDLKPFCSTSPGRAHICQPWSEAAWTFATDGRILVRVPRLADVPVNPSAPKNVNETICSSPHGEWFALPTFVRPLKVKCWSCEGAGNIKCLRDDCTDMHKCPACEGEGTVEEVLPAVEVGIQRFNPHYLALLAELPGIMVANGEFPESALAFKFDGGEGRLMPMVRS